MKTVNRKQQVSPLAALLQIPSQHTTAQRLSNAIGVDNFHVIIALAAEVATDMSLCCGEFNYHFADGSMLSHNGRALRPTVNGYELDEAVA